MVGTCKAKLKPFIPPAVLQLLRRVSGTVVQIIGDYDSWDEASARATGYDCDEVLARVVLATRKVLGGEAAYERDSVVLDHVEYSWPLLASLLQVAIERQSLRVIDFGGSLGSTLRQNKKYFERLSVPMAWHVVEQGQFVLAGREFSNQTLRFYHTIPEADEHGTDVILFASSLCYVEDPAVFVRQAAQTSAKYLILDRLPLIDGKKDRIALQKVSEPIYSASYPVRLFAKETLFTQLLSGWRTIESWECDLQPDTGSRSYGFFMERR